MGGKILLSIDIDVKVCAVQLLTDRESFFEDLLDGNFELHAYTADAVGHSLAIRW